jgi:HEPN domain-containing protein
MQQTDAPKPATPEAQSLLRAAGRDWQTVEILLRAPESPITSVCFHAQQYLEKIMKAVLVSNSVIFRRTHDLGELAGLLVKQGIAPPVPTDQPPVPTDQLSRLNPFAVIMRYEDVEIVVIESGEVQQILEHARDWLAKQIYEPVDEQDNAQNDEQQTGAG